MNLTFPEILIVLFAIFLICIMIDKGGSKILDAINNFYKWRI